MTRADTVRADLHVHSCYSEHPSNWLFQKLGTDESYTDPEHIYRAAKARGMAFVTITDHNRVEGSLILKERHPQDVFTGMEATARFPEDGCLVHVLIYGLTAADFDEIQRLRGNIYDLRDYLRERGLAHSVAHATYAVNGLLSEEHLGKLILLFDVFEGINGGRIKASNAVWLDALKHLTPARLEDLYKRHRIPTCSDQPWVKGFTGGSDDHADRQVLAHAA